MTGGQTATAWYLGLSRADVGEAAILVGDPSRIDRLASHMADVVRLPERRGLRSITGRRGDQRITASAFGMGAPIATVVLHELAALGVARFLRIGTAIAAPPAQLGDFVLADGALRAEGTSSTYAPLGYPAIADFDLNLALRRRLAAGSRRWHAGIFGSYDGFYTEMFALGPDGRDTIKRSRDEARRLGLIATDMETSALLTAARILGARASSLCLATVDHASQEKLDAAALAAGEHELFEVALDALAG